ncbi:MAG TPA: efflux RND transporter periplasmic adaptor subunit [Candidatus Cloacimonadota bacterium]|nr:efflux RND transporter periplasmic adaptor subunit [Candidatus Cloacimonadota bacterium]HPS39752.1 efflux RND transporter periplasmic adaptor subunit [Candidatus Cloacimonadota bacterium]
MKLRIEYIIIGAVLTGLCACSRTAAPEKNAAPVSITTVSATDTIYTPEREYSGTIFASQEANLGSVIPGRIEQILIPEGGYVQRGGLVAVMADEMMEQTKVEYLTLKKDLDRITILLSRGTVSQQEYDHLKARFDASEAKYNMMRKNTEIRAPFAGTVVKHLVHVGENYSFLPSINPGYSMSSGIVSLMQLDPLIVKTEVNEQDLHYLKTGQKAMVTITWDKEEQISGTITRIQPVLSTTTRTSTVEIRIPNPGTKLKPGMFCSVKFELPGMPGVAIPRECLMQSSGTAGRYVFKVEDGIAHKVNVSVKDQDNLHYIVEGLASGDVIAMDGKAKLSDKSRVVLR